MSMLTLYFISQTPRTGREDNRAISERSSLKVL